MGTNYYLHTKTDNCPTWGKSNSQTPLHIGKSSMGWCFALHTIPELNLIDLASWESKWSDSSVKIIDEYNAELNPQEMRSIIVDRAGINNSWKAVPMGYTSWQEFHQRNYSEFGPKNLLRHSLDITGRHCVGHGNGTWDMIAGDFS